MRRFRMARALKFVVIAAVAATVFSFLVMGLWNWLMPAVFGGRLITIWQAMGLLVLSRILFGRFGGPGRRMHWRHRLAERLNEMTPEQREAFLAGMTGRCGSFGSRATGPTV
jgi:hypothetical protein